jgi:hypothetical protein
MKGVNAGVSVDIGKNDRQGDLFFLAKLQRNEIKYPYIKALSI